MSVKLRCRHFCMGINKSTSWKVMKTQSQSISCLQKTSVHLPAVESTRTWSNLQAGFGWLHRRTNKCSITFEYSGFSLANIYFLIFWMSLLTWVLWHPNPQASVTHGSQSVALQDQLRHGSLIRLRLISMGLVLSFSETEEQKYARLSATTPTTC